MCVCVCGFQHFHSYCVVLCVADVHDESEGGGAGEAQSEGAAGQQGRRVCPLSHECIQRPLSPTGKYAALHCNIYNFQPIFFLSGQFNTFGKL